MPTIVIRLEVEGDADEFLEAVDHLLDAGSIQDVISEYLADTYDGDDPPPEIVTALVIKEAESATPRTYLCEATDCNDEGTESCPGGERYCKPHYDALGAA